jgi:hypothetical protein
MRNERVYSRRANPYCAVSAEVARMSSAFHAGAGWRVFRLTQERLAPLGQPSNRRCTRITVLADHGLPVGVATLRSFSALAIALAD